MRDIGKNIRQLRIQKNMTQDELAAALFVTRQTVSNYETGRSRPDVEMLTQIAEVLGTDANCVLYGPPIPPDRKAMNRKTAVYLVLTVVLGIGLLALTAALGIEGLEGTCVFSVGSDGTDGPTDAAGGYVDWKTATVLREQGIHIFDVLKDNDAYHALEKTGGLIITGPTGTNVNDVAVALLNG